MVNNKYMLVFKSSDGIFVQHTYYLLKSDNCGDYSVFINGEYINIKDDNRFELMVDSDYYSYIRKVKLMEIKKLNEGRR